MMNDDDYSSKREKKKCLVFLVKRQREMREIRFFSLSLDTTRVFSLSHQNQTKAKYFAKNFSRQKKKSRVHSFRAKNNTQHKKKTKNKKNVAPGSLFVSVRVRSEDDDDENVFFYHLSDHVLFASEC